MRSFPRLLPKWATKGVSDALKQHSADSAAHIYMRRIQPQFVESKKFDRAAEALLEFLERGECSPEVNQLLERWTERMLVMLQANHETAAAMQVSTRLAAVKVKREGFSVPTLG